MEFKWTISKVQVTENNLVNLVSLIVTGMDEEYSASASYNRYLTRSDSFIPYDQLTEAQVLAWCFEPVVTTWKDMDDVEQSSTSLIKNEGEAQVTGQIARQRAQKAAEPALPWVTA